MEQKERKVRYFSSLKFKIQLMLGISVIVACLGMVYFCLPKIQENMEDINKNYLLDDAKAYGTLIDSFLVNGSEDEVFSYDNLNQYLAEVKIKGCDSSYAYLVDENGTMLYHPTEEKIGNSVENDVVKGVVADLKAGKNVEADCVEYTFKGVKKYASYYVGKDKNFVIVVTADKAELMDKVSKAGVRMFVSAVVIFIIVFVAGFLICFKLFAPLNKITTIINKVAELDFTASEAQYELASRRDEIGVIVAAVNNFHGSIAMVMEEIVNNSQVLQSTNEKFIKKFEDITENVGSVNSAVEDIASGSTSQANETTQATSQVIAIGNVIEENATNVRHLEEIVNKMNEISEAVSDRLDKLQRVNDKTSENIKLVSEQTNSTNASADKIQNAVALIRDIADQTNMLSLNASIEAARAGEAGRGFAVVAEEIRKLADGSAQSAEQVASIVEELVENSNSSVEKMGEVISDANDQEISLSDTRDAFVLLDECVRRISDISVDIATQTQVLDEQKAKISNVVEQLAAISEENAASTEETSASMQMLAEAINVCQEDTETLGNLSDTLKSQMDKFQF